MRRVYILLAGAALVAVVLLAGIATPERAKATGGTRASTDGPPYGAAALAPSVRDGAYGFGNSKAEAKAQAMKGCKNIAKQYKYYEGDCQGAVWVHWGWMAVAMDYLHDQKVPYKTAYGSGWAPSRADARYYAVITCEKYVERRFNQYPNCNHRSASRTGVPYTESYKTTGGPW